MLFRVGQKVKAIKGNMLVRVGAIGIVVNTGKHDSWINFGGIGDDGKWWIQNRYLVLAGNKKFKENKKFKIKYLCRGGAKEIVVSASRFFNELISLELDKEVKEIKVEIINEEVHKS
jgi:hypothetical protein